MSEGISYLKQEIQSVFQNCQENSLPKIEQICSKYLFKSSFDQKESKLIKEFFGKIFIEEETNEAKQKFILNLVKRELSFRGELKTIDDFHSYFQTLNNVFQIKELQQRIEIGGDLFLEILELCIPVIILHLKGPLTFESKLKIIFICKTIHLVVSTNQLQITEFRDSFMEVLTLSHGILSLAQIIGMILATVSDEFQPTNSFYSLCIVRGIIIGAKGKDISVYLNFLLKLSNENQEPQSMLVTFETIGLALKNNGQLITKDQFNLIFGIVIDNWEHSIDAINGKIKTILYNLIEILEKRKELDLIDSFYQLTNRLESNSRVKYGILVNLLPYVDNLLILDSFDKYLYLIDNPLLCHKLGELCFKLVTLNCDFDWIDSVLKYFRVSLKYKNVFDYFLIPLFKLNKDNFVKLATRLKKELSNELGSGLETKLNIGSCLDCSVIPQREIELNLEHALISSLIAAISIGLIDNYHDYFTIDELKESFILSNVDIRIDTLALVLKPKILAPSDSIELFLHFLKFNSSLSEGEQRQRICFICKNYFNQLASWYFNNEPLPIDALLSYFKINLISQSNGQRLELLLLLLNNLLDCFLDTFNKKMQHDNITITKLYNITQRTKEFKLKIIEKVEQNLLSLLTNSYSDNRKLSFVILRKLIK